MKTFNKKNYSDKDLKEKIDKVRNYFIQNLKCNYKLINIQGSNTNGLSIYVYILKDGEHKKMVFRISDHINGNFNEGVVDMGLTYQIQGDDLGLMYHFYGEISKNEARINFLNICLKKYKSQGKENTLAYKNIEKQLNNLLVQQ